MRPGSPFLAIIHWLWGEIMKAGIIIDDWKLPFFEKRLTGAGFTFEKRGHLTPKTLVLTVETSDIGGLNLVVEAAQNAAAKSRAH